MGARYAAVAASASKCAEAAAPDGASAALADCIEQTEVRAMSARARIARETLRIMRFHSRQISRILCSARPRLTAELASILPDVGYETVANAACVLVVAGEVAAQDPFLIEKPPDEYRQDEWEETDGEP